MQKSESEANTLAQGTMQVSSERKPDQGRAVNVFTVDVEDWYQGIELPFERWEDYPSRIEIGLYRLLDLLEEYGVSATFFVLGWMAKRFPQLVKEVANRGHELGSHGFSHEKVYNLSPQAFRQEIRATKDLLQELGGRPVRTHRSPFFSITSKNLWALEILSEEGFAIDCSVSPIKTWRYGISTCPDELFKITDSGITEFPASTFSILNKRWAIGGAYFRILPYHFTKKAFLQRLAERKCTMFYVHPWEYDPEHPDAPMEWKAKLTHYARLRKTYPYTRRLLQHFQFDTVSHVVDYYAANHSMRSITSDLLRD
jgi:polysaccharide deacetylase family protein (PEP-CTERM system associated)